MATVFEQWVADTTQVFPYFVGDRRSSNPTSLDLSGSKWVASSHLAVKPGFHIVVRVCDHHRQPVGVPSQTYGNTFFSVADGLLRLIVMVGKVGSSSTFPIITTLPTTTFFIGNACRRPSHTFLEHVLLTVQSKMK